jgi:hypothetical protein
MLRALGLFCLIVGLRAGDADEVITPIVKQRALLLKKWYEYIQQKK